MDEITPARVNDYWLDEVGPEGWYAGGEALDADIRDRFAPACDAAAAGRLDGWRHHGDGALALLILLDQMPRNIHRGGPRAFAADAHARSVATRAIAMGLDLAVADPARQFFYLPLEHSESLQHQERAVRLIGLRMEAPETLLHARAHREIVRRFGRFPFRNAALGRASSAAERRFLDGGAYGAVLRELRDA
jgi:uncharacterized protein (DUF924 family)